LAGLVLLGALVYFANRPRAEVPLQTVQIPPVQAPQLPDLTQVRNEYSGAVSSLTNSLSGIKDAASADSALPTLHDLDNKLDTVKSWTDKLPDTAKSSISQFASSGLSGLVDRMNNVLTVPGVSDRIRPTLNSIVAKLSNIAGVPSSQYTLTSPSIAPTPSAREN
jgi:hypothetical protein